MLLKECYQEIIRKWSYCFEKRIVIKSKGKTSVFGDDDDSTMKTWKRMWEIGTYNESERESNNRTKLGAQKGSTMGTFKKMKAKVKVEPADHDGSTRPS